jgi:hypothetical protein
MSSKRFIASRLRPLSKARVLELRIGLAAYGIYIYMHRESADMLRYVSDSSDTGDVAKACLLARS